MSALGFSGPNLAVAAYAEVTGSDGTSTVTNSGITTSRVSLGVFNLILPTNNKQSAANDIVQVTVNGSTPCDVSVDNSDATTKVVRIFNPGVGATTLRDADFSVVIWRTTNP